MELAHEAVMRAWPRLQAWLEEDEVGQRVLRHLTLAADTWDQMGRPGSELYRGIRLAQAVEWREGAAPRLAPVEQAFLDASIALEESQRREAEERAGRQATINRRLRVLLAGVGLLSILALVAGVLAGRQAQRADVAAAAADASAVSAEARRVGAQALVEEDVDRSLLLAVEGLRLDDSPDTRGNLLAALGRNPELIGVIRGQGDGVFGKVSVSPDGDTLAVYDDANRMWFHDTATSAIVGSCRSDEFDGFSDLVTGEAAFHPDGDVVAVSVSTSGARPVRLLETQTHRELPDQPGLPSGQFLAWDVAYSPDGRRLALAADRYRHRFPTAEDESIVLVWDIDALEEPTVLEVPAYTHGLAFSPDGRLMYTGTHAASPTFDTDAGITVYDLKTHRVVRRLRVPSHPFALSPDGRRVAAPAAAPGSTGSDAGSEVLLLDAVTGEEQRRLRGHAGQVLDVAFSPDGTHLASSSDDRSIVVWDVSTGQRQQQLRGHASVVTGLAFDPEGATLYSAGSDHAVLTWDLRGDRRFVPVRVPTGTVEGRGNTSLYGLFGRQESYAVVAPGGDAALRAWYTHGESGHSRSWMQVVDAARGHVGPVIDSRHEDFLAAAWHPDGTRFATTGWDGMVRIWDAAAGRVVTEREVRREALFSGIAYLEGGERLLVAELGGVAVTVDAQTLRPNDDQFVVPASTTWTHASPDGRTVAIVTLDPANELPYTRNVFYPDDRLLLVDVPRQQVLHQIDLGFDSEWAAFSPDGGRVAVTGRGGQVALIDVATGTFVYPPVVGHDGNLVSIDYSPDGTTIASGGEDGQVSLWHGGTGALLGRVRVDRPNSRVYVGFTPDEPTVVIATWDGAIHTLDIRSTRWAAYACSVAGRNLTRGEWREAFGDRPYRETCDQRLP